MCGIHELLNFPFEMMCSFKCFKNTCSDSTVFKGLILFFFKKVLIWSWNQRDMNLIANLGQTGCFVGCHI